LLPTARAHAGHSAWCKRTVLNSLLTLGALCGVLAKAADESSHRWAADFGTYPAVWVLALAPIARLSPPMLLAAVRASAFFLAIRQAHVLWSYVVLGFGSERSAMLWLALAASAVPLGAAFARWACNCRGVVPGLLLATLAAQAVSDRLSWQRWWVWVLDDAPADSRCVHFRPASALPSRSSSPHCCRATRAPGSGPLRSSSRSRCS
jgi:hypothetical protein